MGKKPTFPQPKSALPRRLVVRGVNGVYHMMGTTDSPDPPIEADLTKGDGSPAKAMRTKMTERMVLYEELNLPTE